jgi:hypothetical protein
MTSRQLWAKELREGGHKQGKYTLQKQDRFCCLGVACLVYERETGNKLPRDPLGEFDHAMLEDCFECVQDWLELQSPFGTYGQKSLAVFNDNGKTFAEIADIIESEPPGLFVE